MLEYDIGAALVDLPTLLLALDTPSYSPWIMVAEETLARVAKMARRILVARVMFVDSLRSLLSKTIT